MNKTALVTGATQGIGKAIAMRLLKEGWSVIVTYAYDPKANESLNDFKRIAPDRISLIEADASDLSSIDLIDHFLNEKNRTLDAVVLNAGITDRSTFGSITPENWNKVFTVNVHYPVFLLQQINNRLNENGSITFTGSLMGILPHSVSLAYGVTKASVHALIKNLVKFYAEKRIRVNGVAPGFVDTEWQKNKPQEIRDNITRKVALGRFCSPEELTDVYLMLINNSYMNGEIVVCDGGYSYK
ncbi:MAG TPA: SDR family oxidoreductase [Prolixibacteraceae bacterium]|nr:SDR family oxidoreductase [Prolixibacteraceae bacterium]HPS12156.1 SDR family oxidoreductase [Prolixibacteraceae bacterium]